MDKTIIILGAGESGVGTAILAKQKGFSVFVSDYGQIKQSHIDNLKKHNINFEQKSHNKALEIIESENLDIDKIEVMKSPGISDNVPIIKLIRSRNIHIISEIEFAGRYTNAKTICITGSNGKTTTTMQTYHILRNAGLNVGLAGNVGKSLAQQVAENNYDYFVIELSSFQLDGMYEFKADVAIITNITPDHLDRYDNKFQNYINSKFRIIQNQTEEDTLIFFSEDKVIQKEISKRKIKSKLLPFGEENDGKNMAFMDNNYVIFKDYNKNTTFLKMNKDNISIKGKHNIYNSMASGLASQLVGINSDIIQDSLTKFHGVEHRMEYVTTVRGVKYINDSKATNVNSCWYALQSMKTPVVLILGGTDKGNDYNDILELIQEKVHTLIFLGADNSKLISFFSKHNIKYIDTHSMQDCVKMAYEIANEGDTVLLSPCCASFDLFKNYEERGDIFKTQVKNL